MPLKLSKDDMPIFGFKIKDIVRSRKLLALLIVQFFFSVLFLVELFLIVKPAIYSKKLVFASDFSHYLVASLCLLSIIIVNFALMKKRSELYELQKHALAHVKGVAKKKVKKQRENPYGLTMLVLEFFYIVLIAAAIYFYLDPQAELSDELKWWTRWQLSDNSPIVIGVNALIFLAITGIFLWFHSYAQRFDTIKFKGRAGFRKFRKARSP